jgi:hypothetical protein
MARLVPSFLDDRTPPGERDVFNVLAAGPDDWIALHSLDLAPWNRGLRTEIDFVVIVPDAGILCIEVKSHNDITFDGHRWLPPDIRRSPFKQATDGRYVFYRRLREILPQFQFVPVVHCCIFPNSCFDLYPNLSVQPWELIDSRCFRSFSSASDFCRELKSRIARSIEAEATLHVLRDRLTAEQVGVILHACVPIQKQRPDLRDTIERRDREIELLLRDQQKPILQLTALNPRVVVTGAAGTGKTLIAMEAARRAARDGCRVGLLCFNQLVGDWMSAHMSAHSPGLPGLVVGRAIKILADMAGIVIPTKPTLDFWTDQLPGLIEERLTDPDILQEAAFDYLVVDEAQDLLARPKLWDCLSGLLRGGVTSGSFCLFGDFDNQVLGDRLIMQETLLALLDNAKPVKYCLTENCRNYKIVGESAVRLSGMSTKLYTAYMRTGGSIQNYDIVFYSSEEEQSERLRALLKEFASLGYRSSEITVLSFSASQNCAATRLQAAGVPLRPCWQLAKEYSSYASVQAFKGMENKVVVLTDVALNSANIHRTLFYTGMTRACEYVRVLCHRDSQSTLMKWLAGNE